MQRIHKILLVDDDLDDQFVFDLALKSIDPDVVVDTAKDGIDALDKLREPEVYPELIFLDMNMPRMNGRDFLQQIKSLPSLAHIPVIMYSTSSSPELMEETRRLGALDYIVKPNSFDELCTVLQSRLVR
ncbi:MAG TPA: response regulator [Flavisolibacter sp.]